MARRPAAPTEKRDAALPDWMGAPSESVPDGAGAPVPDGTGAGSGAVALPVG